ncbi:GAF domain-containing protein [Marinomonas sp. THO17]
MDFSLIHGSILMFTPDTSSYSQSSEIYYQSLNEQLNALFADERDLICNAAQLSAFIMQTIDDLNWAGLYFARDNELVLGPYVGKVACTRIPFGRGVCGTAAQTLVVQRIDNVHDFSGHIACDAESASELVIPLVVEGKLVGVFDIDSPVEKRFSEQDQAGIQAMLDTFVSSCDWQWQF